MIAAECPLLAVCGDGNDDAGLTAERAHGGGQADAGALEHLVPGARPGRPGCWAGAAGRRSLSCLARVSPRRCPGDATPSVTGTDGGPVDLVAEQREETSDAGAATALVQWDLETRRLLWWRWFLFLFFLNLHLGSCFGCFHDFFFFFFFFFFFLIFFFSLFGVSLAVLTAFILLGNN